MGKNLLVELLLSTTDTITSFIASSFYSHNLFPLQLIELLLECKLILDYIYIS